MTKKINLPCNGDGDGGNKTIKAESDTITFETSGSCNFTSFNFTGGTTNPQYPPGFSSKTPSDGAGPAFPTRTTAPLSRRPVLPSTTRRTARPSWATGRGPSRTAERPVI